MLSAGPPSSRPRPPAQVRRTSSKAPSDNEQPPLHPYKDASSLESSSSSSSARRIVQTVTTTTTSSTRMTIMDDDSIPSPSDLRPAVHDVLNGRTREELQEMLLAAHNIIRKHEHDLTKSSNETQCLREQNLAMKSQFDKLSIRLPRSPSISDLIRSRSNSVLSVSEAGASTPPMSPRNRLMHTPIRGHRSRPSVTSPVALAQLADQNAELVHKLDQLQEETSMLDQTGRRKLNKLEKEIDLLKDDLERVQKRNMELEKEMEEKEAQKNEEEVQKRRMEREEKARAIRESLKHDSDEGDNVVRDFAPSSSTSVASFSSPVRRSRQSTSGGRLIPFELDLSSIMSVESSIRSTGPSQPGTVRDVPAGETAIVIQLLGKIEELENANREFIRQRAETEAKIQSATEEVSSMRQAYQEAEDEILQGEMEGDLGGDGGAIEEEEWVDEANIPAFQPTSTMGSMRSFKSSDVVTSTLRPQALGSPVKSLRSRSSKGSLKSSRSGPRGTGNLRMVAKRARKPLTHNMFLSPPTSPSMAGSPAVVQDFSPAASGSGLLQPPDPRVLSSRPGRDRFAAVDFSPHSPDRDDRSQSGRAAGFMSSLRSNQSGSLRNVPSFGDMGRYIGALGLGSPGPKRRSLQSELVSDYAEDWTVSQAEISRQMFETSEHQDGDTNLSADTSFASMSSASAVPDVQTRMAMTFTGNPALVALSAALDPGNRGRLLEEDEHILPVGCLRDSPAETFYGLEEAVAARPQRWTDVFSAQPRLITASLSENQKPTNTTTTSAQASPVQAFSHLQHRRGSGVDPWEATLYASDQDRSDQPDDEGQEREDIEQPNWDENRDESPSKRESALIRLNNTLVSRRRRHSSVTTDDGSTYDDAFEIIPADGDYGRTEAYSSQYDPKVLANKLRNTSLETFLEVWLVLQFVMVLAVFVYSSVRQGPRAVMLGRSAGAGSPVGKRARG